MKRFWMFAVIAAFGMAACDTAPETADADAAMEEAMEEPVDAMAMATPALGDYSLVAIEGGDPEDPFEEGDVGVLHLEESTWTFDMNGEQAANGTWAAEDGRVRVSYATGDCAGQESVYDTEVGDTGFTADLVESTCEVAATRLEYEMAGGEMMDDHPMEEGADEGAMEDGGDM